MAKKRRVLSKAQKIAHYKSLMAQMSAQGMVTAIERARYAKYANAVKKLGGSVSAAREPTGEEMREAFYARYPEWRYRENPRRKHGGATLGRNAKGRFVKLNPRSAQEWGHTFGKYAKKGKRKTGEFLSGLKKGWQENPAMSFPQMGVVGNPYGSYMHNPYSASLFGPKANPKRHKSSSKAARGRALAHSLGRDSKGRFVKKNPHRRGHYGY